MNDRLEFELRVTADARAFATIEAYVRETLRHALPLEKDRENLCALVMAAARDAATHAYPPGETGPLTVGCVQEKGCLTLTIRDFGLPQDIPKLENALHTSDATVRRQALGLDWAEAADELHWVSHGPEGKALHIVKWLHETHITDHDTNLEPFDKSPPLAPEQEYEIRRMRPDEAVQVCQLIYKAYGPSYYNKDAYYPDRVVTLNESGEFVSFIVADAAGNLVGHYALERNQDGPVAEGGLAVVDPAHRGRHLLNRLKEAAANHARELSLVGMYGDAVTVHTFSQKMNIDFGAKLVCASLGMAPKTEAFRGIAAAQPQRITCLMYFLWLGEPISRVVHVAENQKDAVAKLYANLGCPVTFAEGTAPEGHGELAIEFISGAAKAFLHVRKIGGDTAATIRHAKRELIERSHAEALFVDLPLAQPGTPATMEALEKEGFSFAGITPQFGTDGDRLRMLYLVDELEITPIHIEEEIGHWLVEYALADRKRVLAQSE